MSSLPHRHIVLGSTLKNLALICGIGTLMFSVLSLSGTLLRLHYIVAEPEEDGIWEFYIIGLSALAIIATMILIWGLYNDSSRCLLIWMIAFILILFLVIVGQMTMLFKSKNLYDKKFTEGKFFFLMTNAVFIYMELLLQSHYRRMLTTTMQLTTSV